MDLTRESIEKAIKHIEELPKLRKGRESIEYDLVYEGKKYPPILVLSEANKILGGKELLLSDFQNSTQKAFTILRDLGFVVEPKGFDFSEQIVHSGQADPSFRLIDPPQPEAYPVRAIVSGYQ